jgi:L-asparagine transporter-like permease
MLLVYSLVAALVVIWLMLTSSAMLSLYWTRSQPQRRSKFRMVMALLPLLLGFIFLNFHLRFQMNDFTMNLSWPFAVPTAFGAIALYFWMRARRRGDMSNRGA